MSENKSLRISKVVKEFNVGKEKVYELLTTHGFEFRKSLNTKITPEMYDVINENFSKFKKVKAAAEAIETSIPKKEKESLKSAQKEKAEKEKDTAAQASPEKVSASVEDAPQKEEPKEEIKETPSSKAATPELPSSETKEETEEKVIPADEPASSPESATQEQTVAAEKEETGIAAEVAEEKDVEPETKESETKEDKTEVKTSAADEESTEEKPPVSGAEKKKTPGVKVLGKIDVEDGKKRSKKKTAKKKKDQPEKSEEKKEVPAAPAGQEIETAEQKEETAAPAEAAKEDHVIRAHAEKLTGPKVLGSIELKEEKKPKKGESHWKKIKEERKKRKKRPRIDKSKVTPENMKASKSHGRKKQQGKKKVERKEISEEDVQKQIKDTLAKLTSKGKNKGAKLRREKRKKIHDKHEQELQAQLEQEKILQVTEFITVGELANMMDVGATEVIGKCMALGMFVSINQRLDAETIQIVADEFGYEVNFITADSQEIEVAEEEDNPEDLVPRAPVVTIMGHVDHGKTKLLDYIRSSNVVAGEAGGITQHIGAYEVTLDNGKNITFLDTPGHEAFTAMRARGAQVTDIVIIVVAADDGVMPQTKEAINHAKMADVPIIIAINKMDKPAANAEKVMEELANQDVLVEEWGGKYQSQKVSAITGQGVDELLDKVLLEAEMLELKANPNKRAKGTVLDSALDKGRGYISNILVQDGTLKVGDIIVAGPYSGKVRALYNERDQKVHQAGPSTPVSMVGLDGNPMAGDPFNVFDDERDAKTLANKRKQVMREQALRTKKHITLDEIGRRIALGDFKELNLIVKGDVDGSVEALSDSLMKQSAKNVQINVIHKGVGQISDSDVLLASASDAIIIGFQVRPSLSARKMAEKEQVDIRLYSVIYDAIEEMREAIEGLLSPEIKERITGNIEVREVYKITKVGTVAGCYVMDGIITRNSRVRLIRDGIVIYTGKLSSLKRFKDDVKEVKKGYECGLSIENYNDIKVGDVIEGFEEYEEKGVL